MNRSRIPHLPERGGESSWWLGRLVMAWLAVSSAIAAAASEAPVAVSPGSSGPRVRVADRCPTFSWTGAPEGRALRLVVYRTDGGSAGGEDPEGLSVRLPSGALSWTPPLEQCLESGARYAWAVGAEGATDRSAWSEPNLFEVTPGPSVAKVEEALRVLRRFVETEGQSEGHAILESEATRLKLLLSEGRTPAQRSAASSSGEEEVGLEPGEPQPWGVVDPAPAGSNAPVAGASSLTVDEQLHLGGDSHIFKEGELLLWEDGLNTAVGLSALSANSTGSRNTAVGPRTLRDNSTGTENTAVGYEALLVNTAGQYNTAVGNSALGANETGDFNTGVGKGALFANTSGHRNTAVGAIALISNTEGAWNTAVGIDSLQLNTTGSRNTAVGAVALLSNTDGSWNTAVGVDSMQANTSGSYNTAVGFTAMLSSETASYNTAVGAKALRSNTTGDSNTAIGTEALRSSTTGYDNTAVGTGSLAYSTNGAKNTAIGARALESNETGFTNTAVGQISLRSNTSGYHNVALGAYALGHVTTGSRNIGIGVSAGSSNEAGSDNIWIGTSGTEESNTIRIGSSADHNRVFIRGIRSVTTGLADAIPVLVDSLGQLGTASSSRSVKQDIGAVGSLSKRLLDLRPVAFRYRKHAEIDPDGPRQFGLIAEEVAEVFPDLVVWGSDGKPETVKYHLLSSLLLSEVQRQHRWIAIQGWLLALLFAGGLMVFRRRTT